MKYRLAKNYPNSPELGYIIEPKSYISGDKNCYYWGGQWFNPADYPEFWECVAPKYIKLLKSDYTTRESSTYRIIDLIYEVEKWKNGIAWVKCNIDIIGNDNKTCKAGKSLCMDALYDNPEYYIEVTKEEYDKQLIPEYVLCTKDETSTYKKGVIYKVDKTERIYYDKLTDDYWAFWTANKHRFIPSTKEEYEKQLIPDYVGTYFSHKNEKLPYLIKECDSNRYIIYWEKDTEHWSKKQVHKLFTEGTWNKITKDDYDRYWKLGKYSKKPLFTTHDGVDIYKGDSFYAYDTVKNKILSYGGTPFTADKETPYPPIDNELYFSTLEAAEKYKKESTIFINCITYVNTPITYTLEEISEVIEKKLGWDVLWNRRIKQALIDFKK